jgi:peptide/nickel transport system substrate-binding protein
MYLIPPENFSPGNTLQFGVTATEANKPFKDERVRQAMSMAIDRDAYIDVFRNLKKFQSEGLAVKGYWYTAIGEGKGWRLDPNSKDFGPNAKYYQHNVDEAKKLLAAAGYANGLEVVSSYISGTQLGPDHQKTVEVRQDMLREAGIRPKTNLIDYTTEYLPKYLTAAGKFDGMVYRSGVASASNAVTWLDWRYKSGGGDGWIGFDLAGVGDGSGDPQVDQLILKARSEVDTEKRRALAHEIQRYLAKAAWCISEPGTADSFELAWPALANYRVFNGDRRTPAFSWWLDDTKAPLKKT